MAVKRLVIKASLQRPSKDHILTSAAMFSFCEENIPGIRFFHVTQEQVAVCHNELKTRFELANVVKGTL